MDDSSLEKKKQGVGGWQKGSDEIEKKVEEKVLKASITEGGKEGKSKAITSCKWKRGFSNAARGKELFWQGVWKRWEWTRERESNCSEQRRRREEISAM